MLDALVGTWSGPGRGVYPTIVDFEYEETIEFSRVPGKPFLVYVQKTKGANGPMHTEMGFLRPIADGKVEFVIAQPTGQTEILDGEVSGSSMAFDASNVQNSTTAKQVDATKRVYALEGDTLRTEFFMAAVGQPMQRHLSSVLTRSSRM
ncbi:FABP family protein [Corynebacterium sp. H130]|uniref:FABP family protein n=1 Tax=Corynebacterium sp. H130 TaxID=3133444 RepID=UPI00309AECAB